MSDSVSPDPRMDSGLYQLIIRLKHPITLTPGKLGSFRLRRGLYIYTGSGRKNLRARIARHFRVSKRYRWHVDYLLQYGIIEKGIVYPLGLFTECELSRLTLETLKGQIPIPRFGASDCRCHGHLIRCPPKRQAAEIEKAVYAGMNLRAKRLDWGNIPHLIYLEQKG